MIAKPLTAMRYVVGHLLMDVSLVLFTFGAWLRDTRVVVEKVENSWTGGLYRW